MIQMSATFYPAIKESPTSWDFVEVPYEVNLSNSNARSVLEALGLAPNFEKSDTSTQLIDDFIERCHVYVRGGSPDGGSHISRSSDVGMYVLHKVAMLLVSATLGKQGGATHWYFA
jgi:hypothetical protein